MGVISVKIYTLCVVSAHSAQVIPVDGFRASSRLHNEELGLPWLLIHGYPASEVGPPAVVPHQSQEPHVC